MVGKLRTFAMIALATAPIAFSLAACDKGPAERAGERIDRAVERAGDKIEDATDRRR
jgi:hypothetical protein